MVIVFMVIEWRDDYIELEKKDLVEFSGYLGCCVMKVKIIERLIGRRLGIV